MLSSILLITAKAKREKEICFKWPEKRLFLLDENELFWAVYIKTHYLNSAGGRRVHDTTDIPFSILFVFPLPPLLSLQPEGGFFEDTQGGKFSIFLYFLHCASQ